MDGRLVRRRVWLSLGAVVVGATLSVPFRHLTEPDEARYAEVAREMVVSGNWLVPHLHGQPYTHKPPLFMWLVAAASRLTGNWTAAAVGPALAALLATLAMVPLLGRRLGMEREHSLLAVAILASTPFVCAFGLIARMDMVLVFTHTVAMSELAALVANDDHHGRWRRHHFIFWGAVGVGILVKGPVALALAVITVVAWAVVGGDGGVARRALAGLGPLLCLGIVLLWLLPATAAAGKDYFEELTIRQTAGRIASSFAHRQPFYYHLLTFPVTALPWTPFVVLGAVQACRRGAASATRLLAVALAAGILFFSLLSGKIVIYLLPLFPLAALLAARAVAREHAAGRLWPALAGLGVLLFGLAAVLAPHLRRELASARLSLAIVGGVVAAVGGLAAVMALAGRRAAGLVTVGGLAVAAGVLPVALGGADRALSAWEIGSFIRTLEPAAEDVATFDLELYGLSLYAGRLPSRLSTPSEVQAALASGRAVVVRRGRWDGMAKGVSSVPVALWQPPFERPPVVVVVPRATAHGR